MKKFIYIITVFLVLALILSSTSACSRATSNDEDLGEETEEGHYSENLLAEACRKEDPEEVKRLIYNGADVNAKNNNGWIPLMWAVVGGNNEIVEMLIDKGADVNAKDNFGRTPLALAAECDYIGIVEMLIDNSVNVNTKDNDGSTP